MLGAEVSSLQELSLSGGFRACPRSRDTLSGAWSPHCRPRSFTRRTVRQATL